MIDKGIEDMSRIVEIVVFILIVIILTTEIYLTFRGGTLMPLYTHDTKMYLEAVMSTLRSYLANVIVKKLRKSEKKGKEVKMSESKIDRLIYRGYFNKVNPKPEGNYILIFASDWHKDYWAFYAYISQRSWREDIRKIDDLIRRLNWRDGDIYVELIDYHDETMQEFYMYLYDLGCFAHWEVLNPEQWEKHCSMEDKP